MKTSVDHEGNVLEFFTPVQKNKTKDLRIELEVPENWGANANNFGSSRLHSCLNILVTYYVSKVQAPILRSYLEQYNDSNIILFAHKYRQYLKRRLNKIKTQEDLNEVLERLNELLGQLRNTKDSKIKRLVDEVSSWHTEQYLLGFAKKTGLDTRGLKALIRNEQSYRRMAGMEEQTFEPRSISILRKKRHFLERRVSTFSKITELGGWRNHLFAAFAAGVAMTFATGVAFTATIKLGDLSTNLLWALVISYIAKDRFKDIFRAWAANKFSPRYDYRHRFFDHWQNNVMVIAEKAGWSKNNIVLDFKMRTSKKMANEYDTVRSSVKLNINSLLAYAPKTKMRVHRLLPNSKIKTEKATVLHTLGLTVTDNGKPTKYKITVKNNYIEGIERV